MSFFITLGIIIGIAAVLILIFNHIFGKSNIIYDQILNAQNHNKEIKISSLPKTNVSNFTTSIWFYVNDWQFNFGQQKNIMYFAKTQDAKNYNFTNNFESIDESNFSPKSSKNLKNLSVFLGEYENNLHIEIETFNNHTNNLHSDKNESKEKSLSHVLQTTSITEYIVPNVELQKWVCLTISVDTRTMDVYLDGKLVNSYILPGTYKPSPENNVFLGNLGQGGFGGFLTRFRYLKTDISPEHSYAIYKEGINASTLGNAFNKYRLKVSFLEYDNPVSTFTI